MVAKAAKSKNLGMEQTVKNPVQGIRNTITSYLKRPRSQVLAEKTQQQQKQVLQQSLVCHDHGQGQGQPTSQLCLDDQPASESISVLPLDSHLVLSLTKQVSSKHDQEQSWQTGNISNLELAAIDGTLGQLNHGHDHNLDDCSQCTSVDSDHEQGPDLEAPMSTTGTVWGNDDNVDSMVADNDVNDNVKAVDMADDTFYCDARGEP